MTQEDFAHLHGPHYTRGSLFRLRLYSILALSRRRLGSTVRCELASMGLACAVDATPSLRSPSRDPVRCRRRHGHRPFYLCRRRCCDRYGYRCRYRCLFRSCCVLVVFFCFSQVTTGTVRATSAFMVSRMLPACLDNMLWDWQTAPRLRLRNPCVPVCLGSRDRVLRWVGCVVVISEPSRTGLDGRCRRFRRCPDESDSRVSRGGRKTKRRRKRKRGRAIHPSTQNRNWGCQLGLACDLTWCRVGFVAGGLKHKLGLDESGGHTGCLVLLGW